MGGDLLHTIPLFKLLPGRPKSTFFSSSFFFGGILLRYLVGVVEKLRGLRRLPLHPITCNWCLGFERDANTDSAAEVKIKELALGEKRKEL